jgi:adenylate cyclase
METPSIAILPFENMSGDPEQEYFSDGMTEELITALAKIPRIFVIARHSSFTYKGRPVKVRQVGRELRVRYLMEGSVRKAGDRVRITAQLIDADTEKHLWAERYDRDLRDLFGIQDEITLEIVKAMQVNLTTGEMSRMTGRGTKNLDAYLKALQAQEQWYRTNREGNRKARDLAKEAIAIDPRYGYPHAIVSWCHMNDVWLQSTNSPGESLRLAGEAIQKALGLDESDHRIHCILSNLFIMQGKNREAIASAQRAVRLCPGGVLAQNCLASALMFGCKFGEALRVREQAMKHDPFPEALFFRSLAQAYRQVGRYEESVMQYKKALKLNPNDQWVYFGLAFAYAQMGRTEEARAAVRDLLGINPKFSLDWLGDTISRMFAPECRSRLTEDIEGLRKADVGLK